MASYQIEATGMGGREVKKVKLYGRAEVTTILALLKELNAHGPSLVLIDETEFEVGLIGPSNIADIAHAWRNASAVRASRIAVVAPTLVVFGLNRMFQLVANEDERIMVFRTSEDATAWLLG